MYAVILTGGKQYRVAQDDVLRIEKIDVAQGHTVTFDQVLLMGSGDGIADQHALQGARVTATVLRHGRADKVRIIKFRRRKHHLKRQGHRQHFTEVQITGLLQQA